MFLVWERVCVCAGVRARLLHSFTARDIKMVYLGVHPCPPLSLSYFCVLSTASMFQHFLYRKFQCCRDDQANLNRWNFKRYVLELITAVQSLKVFQMKVMWIVGAIMNMVRPKIGRICSKKNLSKRVASEIPPQQDNLRNTEKPYFKNWWEKIYIVARDPMLLRPPFLSLRS